MMVEKKQVLYDLRTAYNGPFVVEDFYAEVEKWIREKGFEKEPKKKMEHVTKNGKKIDWLVEAHHRLDDLHFGIVILHVTMDNVKEVVVKKDGKNIRVNNGDVLVVIDGFIQSHIQGSFFQVKPIYHFIRAVIDKFVYNFWWNRWDGFVNSDGRDLLKRIQAFFNVQIYKYQ